MMKELLEQTKLFDTNNYEANKGSKTGILLIHGFTNTTYELKKLFDYLTDQKYHVISDNLPGHGTSVRDCNSTTYYEWIDHVEKRMAYLSSHCDNLYVCGISMGALLAMHISVTFPINGLISAAPVLEFNKPFKVHILNPLLCHLWKSRLKRYEFNKGQKIYYGYNKWPLIALNEVRKLSSYVYKHVLHKITCPSLLIHSKEDYTSIFNNYSIMKRYIQAKEISSMIVDKSTHNIFDCDVEKDIIQNRINTFIQRNIKH